MYYAKVNKETKQIISYEESTSEIVEVKTRAEKPAGKVGYDYIEKVKQLEDGSYTTEWVEVERELTLEERLINAEKKADASMEAIAELYETGN